MLNRTQKKFLIAYALLTACALAIGLRADYLNAHLMDTRFEPLHIHLAQNLTIPALIFCLGALHTLIFRPGEPASGASSESARI